MRPDVALVAPYPPAGELHGGHSGVASYSANLARGLARQGLQVQVVAPYLKGDPDRFADGDVLVHRAFPMGRQALGSAMRAAGGYSPAVTHLQFELFLYGGPPALLGLLPAMTSARRTESPVVVTLHQVVDPRTVDRSYTRLHRVGAPAPLARLGIHGVQQAVVRNAAATIVHEEPFREVLPTATVIPHGIEDVQRMDSTAARQQLDVDDNGFIVLCFGFLAPYKGLELVLDAARLAGRSITVVVAGGEHPRMQGVGGYGEELRARYGDIARFTGWVPDNDVAAWFAAADVAVFPYPRPFAASGVLALAMAHGCPVLMSPSMARCIGAPNVLAMPMNPVDLADTLVRLANAPDRLAELGGWAEILGRGRRWNAVAQQHTRLYEEVLDGQRLGDRSVRAG